MPTMCPHCGEPYNDSMHTYWCKPEWRAESKAEAGSAYTVNLPEGYSINQATLVGHIHNGGGKWLTRDDVYQAVFHTLLNDTDMDLQEMHSLSALVCERLNLTKETDNGKHENGSGPGKL